MKPEVQERIAQIRRGVAPVGYRKTKAGILPNEWQSVRLDSVLKKTTQKNTRNEVRNILTNSAVYGIISQTDFFDKQIANDENTDGYYIVKPGFFVYNPRISVTAPCGPFNKYYGNCDGIMSPLYTVYKPISDSPYFSEYLAHYFLSTYWHRYMKGIANYGVRSDRMNVTSDDMNRMPIPLPPLEEQRRIAEILTTQDKIIALKERRLAEKRRQKTFLAQRLLTGKTRLPGFDGEWKRRRLSEILKEGCKKRVDDTSKYRKITVKLNFKGLEFTKTSREMADKRPFYIRRKDEIIIGKQNYFNGSVAVITDEFDGCICSNAIMSFSVVNANVKFVAAYISQENFLKKYEMLANGTGQKELSEKDFLGFVIEIPTLQEQQAIAEVLTCADREIEALQRDLELEKRKKKALMQLLLTGVVRVTPGRRSA